MLAHDKPESTLTTLDYSAIPAGGIGGYSLFLGLIGQSKLRSKPCFRPNWQAWNSRRLAVSGLDRIIKTSIYRRWETRAKYAAVSLTVVAIFASSSVLYQGADQWKKRKQLLREQLQLSDAIGQTGNALSSMFKSPDKLSDSLDRLSQFERIQLPTPSSIFYLLVDVLNNHKAIQVNSLKWGLLTDQTINHELIVDQSTQGREIAWDVNTPKATIQLEVSGTIQSSDSLISQQIVFEHFIQALTNYRGVSNIAIVESPAMSAESSVALDKAHYSYLITFRFNKV